MIKRHHIHWSSLTLFFLVLGFGLWYSGQARQSEAQSGSACSGISGSLSGYAWSSNIGWIGFEGWEGSDLSGARLNSDCSFTGFGWSPNIGWINFNPGGGDWPSNPGTPADLHGVRMEDPVTGMLSGWARACSPFAGNCFGALDTNTERGGWDGWIKFSDDVWSLGAGNGGVGVRGGVKRVAESGLNKLKGFAWGGDVVGWISFCPEDNDDEPGEDKGCVTVESNQTVSCTASAVGMNATFDADVTPTGSYTYSWSGSDGSTLWGPASGDPYNRTFVNPGMTAARVVVSNGGSQIGESTCTVDITNGSGPQTTVQISGSGSGTVIGSGITCVYSPATGQANDCSENGPVALLTAAPTSPAVFGGWGGDCYPEGTNLTCDELAGSGGNAVAVFTDPSASSPVICSDDDPNTAVCATDPVIKISQQNDGARTNSSRIYIKNVNGLPAIVSIKSINGQTSTLSSNPDFSKTHCNMGDDNPQSCGNGVASYVFSGIPNESFPFSITVDDLSSSLLIDSPYTVTFEILGIAGSTDEETIEFRYQPTSLIPQ